MEPNRRNPLEPRTPEAPIWDPKVTASGVYLTNSMEIASDYAIMIGEDDDSIPIIIGIDANSLTLIPDPQILDLLQEPYDEYRVMLLDWIRESYAENRRILKENGLSQEEIRVKLGKFADFVKKMLLLQYRDFRPAIVRYPSAGQYFHDKEGAAHAILSYEGSWRPLHLFHQVYGDDVWPHLWNWLQWAEDEDESEYSGQRFLCRLRPSPIPGPVIIAAGHMFYSASAINQEQLTRIWKLDKTGKPILIWKQKESSKEAFHGTSFTRLQRAFPEILFVATNPDEDLREKEKNIDKTDPIAVEKLFNRALRLGNMALAKDLELHTFKIRSTMESQGRFDQRLKSWRQAEDRIRQSLKKIRDSRRNPDEDLRALERAVQQDPENEEAVFRYRAALLRSGTLLSIACLWCDGKGSRRILESDPNYLFKCYYCQGHGRRTRDQNIRDTAANQRSIAQTEEYFSPSGHLESDYRLTMMGLSHTAEQLKREQQLMNEANL